jgi:hypothetical protein
MEFSGVTRRSQTWPQSLPMHLTHILIYIIYVYTHLYELRNKNNKYSQNYATKFIYITFFGMIINTHNVFPNNELYTQLFP